MFHRGKALAAALLMPLALAACLFTPGKFASTLDIRADRSFTFTYKGEIQALDLKRLSGKATEAAIKEKGKDEDSDDAKDDPAVLTGAVLVQSDDKKDPDLALTPEEKAERDAEYRELATQIAKEAGYRTVEYRGDGLFWVDYAISGKLSHGFAFPYNQDAQMVFPFVVIELRGKDVVRVKAPGFAQQDSSGLGGAGAMGAMSEGMGDGMGKAMGYESAKMAGTFTLTTNAEIVSQNQEDGARAGAAGKTIVWTVNNRTKDAPTAVLRVVGL
ncbi:MAG: hypothetical protein J7500_16710 [Sphingomonas sp.]|uniref:hypothetical protein n=1 Tax=Sphingomonas sp. TaxID=28214 RepID=UPI001B24E547|nr:hypothetical protein [Sphingomonas sp.]MBO9624352.1 hypothetical protein [Sphingomonas sp.]